MKGMASVKAGMKREKAQKLDSIAIVQLQHNTFSDFLLCSPVSMLFIHVREYSRHLISYSFVTILSRPPVTIIVTLMYFLFPFPFKPYVKDGGCTYNYIFPIAQALNYLSKVLLMCEDMLSVLNPPSFRDGRWSGLVRAEVKLLLSPPEPHLPDHMADLG